MRLCSPTARNLSESTPPAAHQTHYPTCQPGCTRSAQCPRSRKQIAPAWPAHVNVDTALPEFSRCELCLNFAHARKTLDAASTKPLPPLSCARAASSTHTTPPSHEDAPRPSFSCPIIRASPAALWCGASSFHRIWMPLHRIPTASRPLCTPQLRLKLFGHLKSHPSCGSMPDLTI